MSDSVKLDMINKAFDNQQVLNNITVSFERGKIYGITGQNGSGKTVLLRIICGLMKPDSGSVVINGRKLSSEHEFDYSTGFLFDANAVIGDLDGYTNLKILARIRNKISDDDIARWMVDFELDPNNKKKVKKYSLGMKQRLGLIQALMENPSLIILDEPFNGIDKDGVNQIVNIMKKEKESGKTLIVASHLYYDISMYDEIYRLSNGTLLKV